MVRMHHPWRAFRSLTDWTLAVDVLPGHRRGQVDFEARVVTLDRRLLQVERRCTIRHELHHIERGPAAPGLRGKDERAVRQATARDLIALDDLLDGLRWTRQPDELADLLWVTRDVLETRIRHLQPAERRHLAQNLEDE